MSPLPPTCHTFFCSCKCRLWTSKTIRLLSRTVLNMKSWLSHVTLWLKFSRMVQRVMLSSWMETEIGYCRHHSCLPTIDMFLILLCMRMETLEPTDRWTTKSVGAFPTNLKELNLNNCYVFVDCSYCKISSTNASLPYGHVHHSQMSSYKVMTVQR
jgi:hypothetical protein